MMQIYYDDGVIPGICMHTCSSLEEAKAWINEQLKGHTMVNDELMCSEDVMESAKAAFYMVFDSEPIIINGYYEPDFEIPIYVSDLFFTE